MAAGRKTQEQVAQEQEQAQREQAAENLRTRYNSATAGEKSGIRKAAENALGKDRAAAILGSPKSSSAKSDAVTAAEELLSQLV